MKTVWSIVKMIDWRFGRSGLALLRLEWLVHIEVMKRFNGGEGYFSHRLH